MMIRKITLHNVMHPTKATQTLLKKQIPKEYDRKFGKLDNLWKYNLPNAWRLTYTIKSKQVVVLAIILEWITHKEYDKKFKY